MAIKSKSKEPTNIFILIRSPKTQHSFHFMALQSALFLGHQIIHGLCCMYVSQKIKRTKIKTWLYGI